MSEHKHSIRLTPAPPTYRALRPWLPAAVIVLATVAAYANSFRGAFVYDDLGSIVHNPHVRSLTPLREAISLDLWGTGATVDARPVLAISFAVNYAIGQLDPLGYHLANLAIHVCAAVLLLGILRRVFAAARAEERTGVGSGTLAFVCALLWAVHPLQTSAVTYVVQRAESLAGLLYLLAAYAAVRSTDSKRPVWWCALSIAAAVMGAGTKETLVTAPLVIYLLDALVLSRSFREPFRRRGPLYLGLSLTWVVSAALTLSVGGDRLRDAGELSAYRYALTQLAVIPHYLRLVFVPSPLVTAYDWPLTQHPADVLLPGLLTLALLGLTAWGVVRKRWYGMCGAAFLLILAPSSSIIPIRHDPAFEHRMYLPLAAVLVVAVLGAVRLLQRVSAAHARRVIAAALVLLATGALAALTLARNADYRDPVTFWEANVARRPASPTAHYNLASALRQTGQTPAALAHYRRVTELDPDAADAHQKLALLLVQAQRLPEALPHTRRAIELRPDDAKLRANLGALLLGLRRSDEAELAYRSALAIRPDLPDAHHGLGLAALQKEQPQQALPHLRRALALEESPQLHAELAQALLNLQQYADALPHVQALADRDPRNPAHPLLQASILRRLDRHEEAAARLRHAAALAPEDPRILNDLAWLLATCPDDTVRDGQRALAAARAAAAMTRRQSPAILDTLAAAHAAAGDFPAAAATAREALSLLQGQPPSAPLAAEIQRHLDLFLRGEAIVQRPRPGQ